MRTVVLLLAVGSVALSGCERRQSAPPPPAGDAEATAATLTLTDSATAVPMTRPVLPGRAPGDCPSVDKCDFGKEWRTCETIALYREPSDNAPILRPIKAMEKFVPEGGEIELLAPGQIEILTRADPRETGGLALAPHTILEVFGPLHGSRALYYDPNSGRGWSPPADADHWWWNGKAATMTSAPIMTWWVRVKLADGMRGWIKLKSDERIANFPLFSYDEAVQSWDVNRATDDETPDCTTLLAESDRNDPTL